MIPPPCPPGIKACEQSSNHCASLAALPSGALSLAWFSGYREGWDLTSTVFATLGPNASGWSPATVVSRQAGYSRQNPVLFAAGTQLMMFHTEQPARAKDLAAGQRGDPVPNQESLGTMYLASSDDWGAR